MQALVLGMHRSGSSVLTRVLNLLGMWIGEPGDLVPPDENNPDGYWEDWRVNLLDDELLRHLGGAWDRPPELPLDLRRDDLQPFHAKMDEIVARLEPHRPWLVKDPRMSLLLPFWRQHLSAPIAIVSVRHPDPVARSLARRDGFSPARSHALWEWYTTAALRNARDLPCRIAVHERLLADPAGEAARLRDWLRRAGATLPAEPARDDAIAAFVRPPLASPIEEPPDSSGTAARQLYAELVELAEPPTGRDWTPSDFCRAALASTPS